MKKGWREEERKDLEREKERVKEGEKEKEKEREGEKREERKTEKESEERREKRHRPFCTGLSSGNQVDGLPLVLSYVEQMILCQKSNNSRLKFVTRCVFCNKISP